MTVTAMVVVVNHANISEMGYSIYAVGDRVRIRDGDYTGLEGLVLPPYPSVHPEEIVAIKGWSFLFPVLVSAEVEGTEKVFQVAPEFLERP